MVEFNSVFDTRYASTDIANAITAAYSAQTNGTHVTPYLETVKAKWNNKKPKLQSLHNDSHLLAMDMVGKITYFIFKQIDHDISANKSFSFDILALSPDHPPQETVELVRARMVRILKGRALVKISTPGTCKLFVYVPAEDDIQDPLLFVKPRLNKPSMKDHVFELRKLVFVAGGWAISRLLTSWTVKALTPGQTAIANFSGWVSSALVQLGNFFWHSALADFIGVLVLVVLCWTSRKYALELDSEAVCRDLSTNVVQSLMARAGHQIDDNTPVIQE